MARTSVRGYQQQNRNTLLKGMQVYVEGVIESQLIEILTSKAQQIVEYIDNGADIPEYLGHLHDATGIGVYADGMVKSFIPTKHAQKLGKSGFDGVNHYDIDGSEFLQQAISEATSRFASGVWFVIFSAVPYAFNINADGSPLGRGQGFFQRIADLSMDEILAGLRPIAESVTAESAML